MPFRNKLSILILIIMLSFQTVKSQIKFPTQQEFIEQSLECDTTIEVFTEHALLSYMDELGMKYVNFVMGQAKHESAHFKSDLFRNNNNLFGMVKAEKRITTAIGKRKGYALYPNWKASVLDYYYMQQQISVKHNTKKKYYAYIFKNYAKDPSYRKKMQKYIE